MSQVVNALGAQPIETLSLERARSQPQPADAVRRVLQERGQPAAPLIVYWHGGGWVIADLDTYDASARAFQAETGAVVLSVHYRQAPER
ncbi:MAG: alpha/beta hydrolase fold domain-containing protein [Acetobacteraceae bacterium]|nr:alpha/beta hydrolase fold domain-containing protein [Acetobacteraceae bacterium]